MKKILEKWYSYLRKKYGKRKGQWTLWCKRPKTKRERERVVIEAVLTQRTNWKNVEQAMENLRKSKIFSLRDIYQLGEKRLTPLIKPSGFYKSKAKYLFGLTKFIIENYGGLEKMKKVNYKILRRELLKLKGIGEETADSILLYALDKPIFVVDEYTKRFVERYKIFKGRDYCSLKKFFESNLKKDFSLFQDFHAFIVIWGKENKKR
jgi:endonuclease-3 related protein